MDFAQIVAVAASQGGGTAPAPSFGPELVTGGDFASSTGWTLNNWSISGGVAIGPGNLADFLNRAAAAAITNGMTIRTVFTVTSLGGGVVRVRVGGVDGTLRLAPGTYTEDIVTTASDQLVGLKELTFDGTCDNLSMKQIL